MAEEKEFIFTGDLSLGNVWFTIRVRDIEDAKRKAKEGVWEDWSIAGAECVNWDIDPSTCDED